MAEQTRDGINGIKGLWRFKNNQKIITTGYVLGIIILLLLTLRLYYKKVYTDNQHTFWATVENNLVTSGLTKSSSQSDATKITSSILRIESNPINVAQSQKMVADLSTYPRSHVDLEAIGTTQFDFQRYSHIDRPKKKANYSYLYKLWLKNNNPQIFGNAVLGPFIIGNLPQDQRHNIMQILHSTYREEINSKSIQNGRPVYTYAVSMNVRNYATAAHAYAKYLGLPAANQISPSNYDPNMTVSFLVSIDIRSREIKAIKYQNSDVLENYSSYGLAPKINVPTSGVSSFEFEKAVNSTLK